jgi:hypothetical protein
MQRGSVLLKHELGRATRADVEQQTLEFDMLRAQRIRIRDMPVVKRIGNDAPAHHNLFYRACARQKQLFHTCSSIHKACERPARPLALRFDYARLA